VKRLIWHVWTDDDLHASAIARRSGRLALAPEVDRDGSFAIGGEVLVATKGGVVIDVPAGIFKQAHGVIRAADGRRP
jgi:hypothetical protein